jgi:hypothetical protein
MTAFEKLQNNVILNEVDMIELLGVGFLHYKCVPVGDSYIIEIDWEGYDGLRHDWMYSREELLEKIQKHEEELYASSEDDELPF